MLIMLTAYPPFVSAPANKSHYLPVLWAVIASLLLRVWWIQKRHYPFYRQWNKVRNLYTAQAYEVAIPQYFALYASLKHRPGFLFEDALCLARTGHLKEANEWLERATRLSGDPCFIM